MCIFVFVFMLVFSVVRYWSDGLTRATGEEVLETIG
jgi:hypothetical protein